MDRMNEYIGAAYLFTLIVGVLWLSHWARSKGGEKGRK